MKEIYLDHAATTYVDDEVKKEMDKYFSKIYGNPGSFNNAGLIAKNAVDDARDKIASILNCKPNEIIFTGSGTESINLAIQGVASNLKNKGRHIITSSIEHHSVLETCKYLEKDGFEISYVNVDKNGIIKPEKIEKSIRKDTILITVMYANNEIGTIQPIKEISKIAKKNNILMHTDACQAAGYLDINVNNLNIDLMSLNGSKIYAPKGIGILYKKDNVKIKPLIYGGGQEFNLRSGTENVPGIVGIAKALELVQKNKEKETIRLIKLRDKLINGILKNIPKSFLNGDREKRLPNNVNISILDIEGESLILYLNEKKVYASTGSACSSKSLEPSHVILALGNSYEVAHGSIRFTLGKRNKEEDINYVIKILPGIVKKLREISPVNLRLKDVKKS